MKICENVTAILRNFIVISLLSLSGKEIAKIRIKKNFAGRPLLINVTYCLAQVGFILVTYYRLPYVQCFLRFLKCIVQTKITGIRIRKELGSGLFIKALTIQRIIIRTYTHKIIYKVIYTQFLFQLTNKNIFNLLKIKKNN